ncbi:MAG: 2Fe-2S iron-sulfur cluster-binding protein [Gammaproteobacteria bacterium WSBS_2016_MAG_OTU1]
MSDYRITLRNRGAQVFTVDDRDYLLDALEDEGAVLPYGCRYGGCMTCAAKLISGEVDQSEGVALKPAQISAGYVLLCVAYPKSDCVLDVGVDSHDNLYCNPFKNPQGFR